MIHRYDLLHEFAHQNRISYNALCAVVERSLIPLRKPALVKSFTEFTKPDGTLVLVGLPWAIDDAEGPLHG